MEVQKPQDIIFWKILVLMPKDSVCPKAISLRTEGLIFGFFLNFYIDIININDIS